MAFVIEPTRHSSDHTKKVPAFTLEDFKKMTAFPFESELPDSPFASPVEKAPIAAEEASIDVPLFVNSGGLSSSKHASRYDQTKNSGTRTTESMTLEQATKSGLGNGLPDAVQSGLASMRIIKKQRGDAAPASFDAEQEDWLNITNNNAHEEGKATPFGVDNVEANFNMTSHDSEKADSGATGTKSPVESVRHQQQLATDWGAPPLDAVAPKTPVESPKSDTTEILTETPKSAGKAEVFSKSSPSVVIQANDGSRVEIPVEKMTRLRKSPPKFDDRYLPPRGYKRSPDGGFTEDTREFIPAASEIEVAPWEDEEPSTETVEDAFKSETDFARMALSEVFDLASDYRNSGTDSEICARDALKAIQKVLHSYVEVVLS